MQLEYSLIYVLQHDNKPLVRESWMIELPEDKPNFCGLGPRQFLRKTPQQKGDRSVWTDTPADKERKAQVNLLDFDCFIIYLILYCLGKSF